MTIRREPLLPIRQDLRHQHPGHAKVTHERDIAERNPETEPLERPRSRRPAALEKT